MNFLLDKIWFISAKCHVVRYCVVGVIFIDFNSSSNWKRKEKLHLNTEKDFPSPFCGNIFSILEQTKHSIVQKLCYWVNIYTDLDENTKSFKW